MEEKISLSSRALPIDYALGVAEDWARKQAINSSWANKDAAWRSQPATPKQVTTLKKMGIHFNYDISKGQASQLLDSKFSEPATDKQLYWLRKHGLLTHREISKIEASKIIAQKKVCYSR
jgi:hypothetical protein